MKDIANKFTFIYLIKYKSKKLHFYNLGSLLIWWCPIAVSDGVYIKSHLPVPIYFTLFLNTSPSTLLYSVRGYTELRD